MSVTDTAAPQPSFLEKLGAEALDILIPQAQAEETYVLAFVDGELAAGVTNVGAAVAKALTSKIPLVGGTIAAEIETELTSLEPVADGYAKAAFDKAIAYLQAKAKSWGG